MVRSQASRQRQLDLFGGPAFTIQGAGGNAAASAVNILFSSVCKSTHNYLADVVRICFFFCYFYSREADVSVK